MAAYAETQPVPDFFSVVDVARRIAGTGSLGLERYVILVRGRGALDSNFLLDLKLTPGSALAPYVPTAQPTVRDRQATKQGKDVHFHAVQHVFSRLGLPGFDERVVPFTCNAFESIAGDVGRAGGRDIAFATRIGTSGQERTSGSALRARVGE